MGRSRHGIPFLHCPSAIQYLDPTNPPTADCIRCGKERWSLPEPLAGGVCRVDGLCGRKSLCVAIKVGQIHPVTLVAQSRRPDESSGGVRAGGGTRLQPADAKTVRKVAVLHLAATLLGWLRQDLEAALQAWLGEAKLKDAGLQLHHLAVENARLRKELHRRIPEVSKSAPSCSSGSHAEQIVQQMLDYVHQHYHHPMSLTEVADTLRMNPAYLSDLFSKTAGVTFHHYLDEIRLAKAEELLQQTRMPVCEVACAVGYATPNHFREVFKAREGLSPTVWRQIRQAVDDSSAATLVQALLPFPPS